MFDSEEDDFLDSYLQEDLLNFEQYLKGGGMNYVESERLEFLIDHYLSENQYSKADLAVDYASCMFPYDSVFIVKKAQTLSALGQLSEALNLISEIENIENFKTEYYLTKATIFSQLKNHDKAIKYYKEALLNADIPEAKDEIYLDIAIEYQTKNDYVSALNTLKEAIKFNPNNEEALGEIAVLFDLLNEDENAINFFINHINYNPYSAISWYNLGTVYFKNKNFDKAIEAYEYCLVIQEDFADVYNSLGDIFMEKGDFDKALDFFKESIKIDGENPTILCCMGECYEQLNDFKLAEYYYKKSLELDPEYPESWLGRGIIEDMNGNTREGIAFMLKAASLEPTNFLIFFVLAETYEKIENYDAAIENYKKSLQLEPSNEDCLKRYTLLASYFFSEIAILDFLIKYEDNFGKNKSLELLLVNQLWKMGYKNKAIDVFKTCVENDSEYAKELFEINSKLKNIKELTNLID
jgi:tetratricopeptide (TPR) repeat protein